jgi:hypothetical protein
MRLNESIIFYLLVGIAVAVAVYLRGPGRDTGERTFRLATAVLFWPLYLPVLLSRSEPPPAAATETREDPDDDMARAIAQVETELDAALSSLDGWAEDVLARETERIDDTHSPLTTHHSPVLTDRRRQSEDARRKNIERLRQVRRQAHDDLMGTLAWVRELVSMIHLAKFTGAPASRAEELVAQIAAAVEGVSAVTWQEEATV